MVDPRFYKFIRHLWRGGKHGYYWTPDGPERTADDGSTYTVSQTFWTSTDKPAKVPPIWKNAYFGINPTGTKHNEHRKASLADVVAVNCLYAEFDAKDFKNKAEILTHIQSLKFQPSILNDSGGGYHGYWLLADTVPVTTVTPDPAIVQHAWVRMVGGDQSVHDLARVLRIPGTLNHKYTPPRPVDIIRFDMSQLYEYADLVAACDAEIRAIQNEATQHVHTGGGGVSLSDQELLDKAMSAPSNGAQFTRLWAGDHDGDHSAADQALCNLLAFWTGKDEARMDAMFRASGLYRDKWDRDSYRNSTIQRAIKGVRNVYDPSQSAAYQDAQQAVAGVVDMSTGQGGKATNNGAGPQPQSNGTGPAPQAAAPKPKARKTKDLPTYTEIGRHYMKIYPDTIFSRGSWMRYEKGVWESVTNFLIEQEVWKLLEAYEPQGIYPTTNGVSNVMAYVRAQVHVPEDHLDADDGLINLLNGTYSLDQQCLLTHHRDRYLTTQLAFDYDPTFQAPSWDRYIGTTFVDEKGNFDPDLAAFVQEAVGYSLTTDIRYHLTFWCHGQGANGKGVLFQVLEMLAGNSAIPFNVNLLHREQYQLADLAGKRIALCTEAESSTIVEDALIKALVAGDSLQVRQIRREPFTLKPVAKLWWSMNKLPTVTDTSVGFWRRVKVIPFLADFEERDKAKRLDNLIEYLQDELPGIFNWALIGLFRLRANGEFTKVAQVDRLTERYQRESNTITSFVDDECEVSPSYNVASGTIYDKYREWCSTNGYKPYNSRNFKSEMERQRYYYRKTMTVRVYDGLRIKGQGNAIP